MKAAPIPYDKWGQCGKYFEWKNHNVFFQRGGKGKSLLMLHGFPTCSWDWCWVSPMLVQRFYMVQPDLLDAGRSLNAKGVVCTIMEQADMLEALMKQRGITSTHILAHNVGDTVAQELLARQNAGELSFHIESCIFINGGIIPHLHKARIIQYLLASPAAKYIAHFLSKDRFLKSFSEIFGANSRPTGDTLKAFWPAIAGVNGKVAAVRRIQYMNERRRHADRWTNAIREAHMPLMFICGLDDPISGAHMAKGFEELVPKAKIARLPGIGHYPQCEAPETTAEFIHRFHDCIEEKTVQS